MSYADLPHVNAALNATSGLCLAAGYLAIRAGRRRLHAACMTGALSASALFFVSYVVYHIQVGSVPFRGVGAIRTVYFGILVSHVILALAVPPLAVATVVPAVREHFDRHRRLARITLPVWGYVSVTGVAVYWMLYRL